MYREDEFYYITDRLHHDIYYLALKKHITKEERLIVKILKKDKDIVVIETCNGKDTIIKDTRKNKNSDILEMDLIFVKMMERYVSSYELPNMYYESIEGVGSWYRAKIESFDPKDKDLKIFMHKKNATKEDILKQDVNQEIKDKQLKFLNIVKGLKFTSSNKVKKLFLELEK